MYDQPAALQEFLALQELSGVAHSLEPLHALEPAHLTRASLQLLPHMVEQPVANNVAAAAANARAVLDVRFI